MDIVDKVFDNLNQHDKAEKAREKVARKRQEESRSLKIRRIKRILWGGSIATAAVILVAVLANLPLSSSKNTEAESDIEVVFTDETEEEAAEETAETTEEVVSENSENDGEVGTSTATSSRPTGTRRVVSSLANTEDTTTQNTDTSPATSTASSETTNTSSGNTTSSATAQNTHTTVIINDGERTDDNNFDGGQQEIDAGEDNGDGNSQIDDSENGEYEH